MLKHLILLIPFLFLSVILKSQDRGNYFAPNYSVKFLSYFGIGSEFAQKKSIIGFNAAHYAKMQKAFPKITGQGLGVPVYFYQEIINNSGALKYINEFASLKKHSESKRAAYCQKIQKAIRSAKLPLSLVNQLNNAYDEFYKNKKICLIASPNFYTFGIDNAVGSPFEEFQINTDKKDLSKAILEVYAQLWDSYRVRLLGAKRVQKLAMGILIRESCSNPFAEGYAETIYTYNSVDEESHFSVFLNTKRNTKTECIYFPRFDSKWYRVLTNKDENSVFVQNQRLTSIARQIQTATVTMDATLKKEMPFFEGDDELYPEYYMVQVDYSIQDDGKNPPKLRLLKAHWYYKPSK